MNLDMKIVGLNIDLSMNNQLPFLFNYQHIFYNRQIKVYSNVLIPTRIYQCGTNLCKFKEIFRIGF